MYLDEPTETAISVRELTRYAAVALLLQRSFGALSEDEHAELQRLGREVAEMAMEHDLSSVVWVKEAMGR